MPILLLSAGQAGATAPAPIAGAIVQAVAECLAGLVYVYSIKPGHPCIFGTWPFVSDLRTGAMSGGSGEQALLTAGCAQMHRFYDSWWSGSGNCRCKNARYASRLGTSYVERYGWSHRPQHGL